MTRRVVTDEQIAAARLRLVLDRRAGRVSEEAVRRLADMTPGQPLQGDDPNFLAEAGERLSALEASLGRAAREARRLDADAGLGDGYAARVSDYDRAVGRQAAARIEDLARLAGELRSAIEASSQHPEDAASDSER